MPGLPDPEESATVEPKNKFIRLRLAFLKLAYLLWCSQRWGMSERKAKIDYTFSRFSRTP